MENEIMNYEDMEIEVTETEGTGMKTGVAVLLGAGITLAVGGVVKLVGKIAEKRRAKKAQQAVASDHDFVDSDDEAE